jgi:hypothetical protein
MEIEVIRIFNSESLKISFSKISQQSNEKTNTRYPNVEQHDNPTLSEKLKLCSPLHAIGGLRSELKLCIPNTTQPGFTGANILSQSTDIQCIVLSSFFPVPDTPNCMIVLVERVYWNSKTVVWR